MARGKKKHGKKYRQGDLTSKAMSCISNSYCNTIDNLSLLYDIKKEIHRLHTMGMISPFIAYETISNVSRRIKQIHSNFDLEIDLNSLFDL